MLKLSRADLLIVAGLELEIGYLPPLIDQSRNDRIHPGSPGYLDASIGCDVLKRPTAGRDPGDGRRPPLRQPALLDRPGERARHRPRRSRPSSPSSTPAARRRFAANLAAFEAQADREGEGVGGEDGAVRRHQGGHLPRLVAQLRQALQARDRRHVEPKPGIPPSPSHTLEIINLITAQKVPVILVEPYFDLKTPDSSPTKTGAVVVTFYPSVGGVPEIEDYFDRLRRRRRRLRRAMADWRWQMTAFDILLPGVRRQPDPHRHPRLPRGARGRARRHLRRPVAGADRRARAHRRLPRRLRHPHLGAGLPVLARLHVRRRGDLRPHPTPPQDAHPAGGDHRHRLRGVGRGGDPG